MRAGMHRCIIGIGRFGGWVRQCGRCVWRSGSGCRGEGRHVGSSQSLVYLGLKTTPEVAVPLYSILEASVERILGELCRIL
jgi:hypothetical protein